MTAAMYVLLTSTFFSSSDAPGDYDALVKSGFAVMAMQGKIAGYRLSPAGYRHAMMKWGHQQQDARP